MFTFYLQKCYFVILIIIFMCTSNFAFNAVTLNAKQLQQRVQQGTHNYKGDGPPIWSTSRRNPIAASPKVNERSGFGSNRPASDNSLQRPHYNSDGPVWSTYHKNLPSAVTTTAPPGAITPVVVSRAIFSIQPKCDRDFRGRCIKRN